MTVRKTISCLLLALALLMGLVPATQAETAGTEITDQCAYTLPKKIPVTQLTDGSLLTRLTARGKQTVAVALPDCQQPSLYVTWFARPRTLTLRQLDRAGKVLKKSTVSPVSPFERYELDPLCRRVELSAAESWSISTLRVFDGQLPEELPWFGAPLAQADMLIILGQPQALFEELGGLAPLCLDRYKLKTAFCFLSEDSDVLNATAGDPLPLGEALTALWSLGYKEAPFLGGFLDHDYNELQDIRRTWGEKALKEYLVKLLRTLRPQIVVCAAGDEANQRSAFAASRIEAAVQAAADESQYAKLGPAHDVQKLYLSDPEGATVLSYACVSDQTAAAYRHIASRQFYKRPLPQEGRFTLAYTAVGPDERGDDLLEHLDGGGLRLLLTPAELETPQPIDEAAEADPFPFLAYGDSERVELFDDAAGRWVYRSDILSVEVRRQVQQVKEGRKLQPVTSYIAHIYSRNCDSFYPTFASARKDSVSRCMPQDMALRYRSVLWFTGDNLINAEKDSKGILIRDGCVYSTNQASNVMAYYGEALTFRVIDRKAMDAQTLWDSGVQNALSFPRGSDLIRGGQISSGARKRTGRNPRCALGMVAPGHFVVVVTDGRQPGYSVGFVLQELAELMLEEGCVEAYNLDGGISTCMYFLGVKLNHHLDEDGTGLSTVYRQRALPEGLAWGYSELCGTLNAQGE